MLELCVALHGVRNRVRCIARVVWEYCVWVSGALSARLVCAEELADLFVLSSTASFAVCQATNMCAWGVHI